MDQIKSLEVILIYPPKHTEHIIYVECFHIVINTP